MIFDYKIGLQKHFLINRLSVPNKEDRVGNKKALAGKNQIHYIEVSIIKTVQDFLIKLGIKPLLEISIFSINNDIVIVAKIMINLVKDLKILRFKVIFQCLKLLEVFQKEIL